MIEALAQVIGVACAVILLAVIVFVEIDRENWDWH